MRRSEGGGNGFRSDATVNIFNGKGGSPQILEAEYGGEERSQGPL